MYAAPKQFDQRLRELIEEAASLRDQLDERAGERAEQGDSPTLALAPQPSC